MIIQTIAKFFKLAAIPLLLGFPIAIIAYRLQVWQMATSFQIIKFTGYGSAIIFTLALLLALFSLFKKQANVAKSYGLVMILLAIPVIGLSMQASKAKSLPFIHHVSTDTVNPPKFQAIVALRGENSNPLAYDSEKLAPLQKAAYPKVKSIMSELNTQQAFSRAVDTAMNLGWEIVAKNAEQGIIEAVDTTLLWAFKDDVVIRIQATTSGSKIDLRSISRIGGTDLGANAKRVETFISNFSAN
ncbi:DUF1499 domain-containing protein [Cognaticolwellia aestuarii]|uniref:DUF1499 domain-containing protein n=1 Tax=Cognaticolwellia aestuarii TaxID=329993 RepID=UPI0009866B30|nr:DUF1499 domain-containing protein [Cognaticolwellia aestuarii]